MSWYYTVEAKQDSELNLEEENVFLEDNYANSKNKSAMSMKVMRAKDIEEVLYKRIAYVSGGKDRNGRYVLTIPNLREPYPYPDVDIGLTFRYLANITSELCKNKGFSVILDARCSSWTGIKSIMRMVQFHIPDEITCVYIIRPEDFWQKQKAILNFKKHRDLFGFKTTLVSADKLAKYVERNQLTRQFGGWLYYNHNEWIRNRITTEQCHQQQVELNNNYFNKRQDESTTEPESEYMSDSGHVSAGTPTSNSTSSRSTQYRPRSRTRTRSSTNDVHSYKSIKSPSSRARSTSPVLRSNRKRFMRSKTPELQALSARLPTSPEIQSPSEKSVFSLPTPREKLMNMPSPLRHKHRSHDDILSEAYSNRRFSNTSNFNKSSDTLSQNTLTYSPENSVESNNQGQVTRRKNIHRNSKEIANRRRTMTAFPSNDNRKLEKEGGVKRSTSCGNVAKADDLLTSERIENGMRSIYDWIVGIGERSLQNKLSVGDSLSSVKQLIKEHKLLIRKANGIFNLVPDLRIQISKIKRQKVIENNSDFNIVEQLTSGADVVSRTCDIFQQKLGRRSNILAHSLAYYQSYEKVTKSSNMLISLCKGEASLIDTRDSIMSAIDRLKEYRETTAANFVEFEKQAKEFLNLLKKEQEHPYISNKYVSVSYLNEISFVEWSLEEVGKRVRGCSESGNLSNETMSKVFQLKSAEEDVVSIITWLCELSDSIKHQHYALGTNADETDNLRLQHEEIKATAKRAFDDGNAKLSAIFVLRRTLDLGTVSFNQHNKLEKKSSTSSFLLDANGEVLPSLEEAWKSFFQAWGERSSRLAVAYLFHLNSEKVIKRVSQLEVDMDSVFPLSFSGSLKRSGRDSKTRSSNIRPLKDTHENLRQEMEHMLSVGTSLLKDSSSLGRPSGDTAAIETTMQHIDFLRSSLHSKWSKMNKRKASNSRSSSASWLESVKESTEWLRIKLVEYSPCSFVIGKNLKEAEQLMEEQQRVEVALKSKEGIIEDLLKKCEEYLESCDTSHRAMARSLGDMWAEVKMLQKQRSQIIQESLQFYQSAEEFSKHLTYLEQYLKWDELPRDKFSAESILQTHQEMHENMLEASVACLSQGQAVLNELKAIKTKQPDNLASNYGSACTTVECTLESLIDRRRQVEHGYNQRKIDLEQSLQTCEWESEVKKVILWFRKIKDEENLRFYLGDNINENESLQKHVQDVKSQVKNRLNKVKYLLSEASEQLSAFGSEPISARATELDDVVEDLISHLDKQSDVLIEAGRFYDMFEKSIQSLENITKSLENSFFSTDMEELDEQCSKYAANLERSTSDIDKLGEEIIMISKQHTVEGERSPSEGIESALDKLNSHKDDLCRSILKHREDAIRINEMSGLYFRQCQELSDWITKSAGEMLLNNAVLGDKYENAMQFLMWHKAAMEDVQKKKISILESVVQTANVLLEAGVSHPNAVKDRAEELRSDWSRLNKNVNKRVELAEAFINHISVAEEASDNIKAMLKNLDFENHEEMRNMEESERKELQEKLQDIQEKCLTVLDQSAAVVSKLKEREEEDNLDTDASVEICEKIASDLRRDKDALLDLWLTWQYRDGVDKDANAQWQNVQSTADRLINALENLHMTIFEGGKVRIGFDVDSSEYLINLLSDRQTLLHSIHGEIEKLVKLSEMLSVRSPLDRGNTTFGFVHSKLIKSVISHHKILQDKLKKYSYILQMSKNWHRDCAELENILMESEAKIMEAKRMAVVTQPKKETYVTYLLKNHDTLKREIDDLLVSVANIERQITSTMTNMHLKEETDDGQMQLSEKMAELVNKHIRWREIWEQHNETLCFQLDTAWYNTELRKHKVILDDCTRKFTRLQRQNLVHSDKKSDATDLVTENYTINESFKGYYEDCEAFIPLARERMAHQVEKQIEVNESLDNLRQEWVHLRTKMQNFTEDCRHTELYYTICAQCETWNSEIKRRLSALKQRIANLSNEGDKDIIKKSMEEIIFQEQEDRTVALENIFNKNIKSLHNKHDSIKDNLKEIKDTISSMKKKITHAAEGTKISFANSVKVQPGVSSSVPKKFVFVPNSITPPPGILKKSKPVANISQCSKENKPIVHTEHTEDGISIRVKDTYFTKQKIDNSINDKSDAKHHLSRPAPSWESQVDSTDDATSDSGDQSDDTIKARNATPDSFTSVTADEIDESITCSTTSNISDFNDLTETDSQVSTIHSVSDKGGNEGNEYIKMMGDFVQIGNQLQQRSASEKQRSPASPPPRKFRSLRHKIKARGKVNT